MRNKYFTINSVILIFLICSSFNLGSQTIKTQAEEQLRKMTPAEIDAKIREYGLTRAQAEAKAREYGVDLESYLINKNKPDSMKIELPTQATEPTPSVKKEINPSESKQNTQTLLSSPEPAILVTPKEPPKVTNKPDELSYFGYNLFKTNPSVFEPRPLIDDQYLIGENDILSISLWGDFQSYNEYKVDKEGRILVNTVGPISVGGYTVEKAKNIVLNALGKVYSGLKKSPPSMFMDLTVARLRPLRVFIMGEVTTPGGYAVSSVGNVFNSLFSSGGPKITGSLREIRVLRNNKVVNKVDLYDYLIGNQKASDEQIKDNDVIFVPLRGKTVGIKGAVMREAYFELLPNENLKKLIDFSGGIKNTFYLERIQVDRIVPFEERKKGELDRKIFDIDFRQILTAGKDFKLEDGDIITIFPILDEKKNYADISGSVWRPGRYQLEKISTISDLVKEADGLRPEAYPEQTKVIRTYDNKQTEIFYINIELALKGDQKNNLKLMPRDNIYIFSRFEMLTGQETVTLEGIAKRPGTYTLHQNQTLYDLIKEAVGLSDTLFRQQVYLERADLIRLNEDRYTSRIIPFNLWELYNNRTNDTLLLPNDRVVIYPINTVEFTERYVEIAGKVKMPGRYKLSENMTVFDLIMQANGYTEDASTEKGELSRLERKSLSKDSLTKIYMVEIPDFFDVSRLNQKVINECRAKSVKLQHRDQLYIRPNPNYIYQKQVTVEGEVEHPGIYVLSILNERLSNIIKRAGGVKKSGYLHGGQVVRYGTRLRINVEDAVMNPEGENDIILQNGDQITIPRRPYNVTITGEVNNPGIFSYVDGKKMSFYIEQSGGETDSADFALITYPTGMTEKVGLHWWSSNPKIPDGSRIQVAKLKPEPPKLPEDQNNKVTIYEVVKDMTALMVSTLTILILIKQLK